MLRGAAAAAKRSKHRSRRAVVAVGTQARDADPQQLPDRPRYSYGTCSTEFIYV
jgi:hypothetical protein